MCIVSVWCRLVCRLVSEKIFCVVLMLCTMDTTSMSLQMVTVRLWNFVSVQEWRFFANKDVDVVHVLLPNPDTLDLIP